MTQNLNESRKYAKNLETATKFGMSADKQRKALEWLKKTFKQPVSNTTGPSVISKAPSNSKKSKIELGGLYIFEYEAITKGLPYWDRMPLVIPYREDSQHFWGINLHYAPPIWRAKILDRMRDVLEGKGTEKQKRMQILSELGSLSGSTLFAPLIKCYLKSQVKSKFMYVGFDHWETVVYLPLARFNVDERQVFKDFKKRM